MASTIDSPVQVMEGNPSTSASGDDISGDKYQPDEQAMYIMVKHNGTEYKIENLIQDHTIGYLKMNIYWLTNVKPERQKLFGIAGTITDETQLDCTSLKTGMKIMMMGSQEKEIAGVMAASKVVSTWLDDFDIGDDEYEFNDDANIPSNEDYKQKISRRVRQYKINMLSDPRPGKKLLVLDIDYTLFDHRSTGQSGAELTRPFLHEFLTSAYKNYDIVIWSATNMKYILAKLKEMRMDSNPNYKLLFYLDSAAMISVMSTKYGFLSVKPLAVIWDKFPKFYSSKNTIMFDDIRRNFLMNPKNGLKIKAYREAHQNRETDKELLNLSVYLEKLAELDDFSKVDHDKWKSYCKKHDKRQHHDIY